MDERCPYCNAVVEICHDDGYGMDEGQIHQQDCASCGKVFTYTTYISVDHVLEKAPCLNDEAPHAYAPTHTYPVEFTMMRCPVCGEERVPTPEELDQTKKIRRGGSK